MLTLGCINSKPAAISAGALGFWWLRLLKGLCPYGSRPNVSQAVWLLMQKKTKTIKEGFYTFQSRFGLHILPDNPKPGVTSFATSLIILLETYDTTQWISSPQTLLHKAVADKIYQVFYINFLESEVEVGVIWMLPSRVAFHLTSSLPFLQCTSLNFTLQFRLVQCTI